MRYKIYMPVVSLALACALVCSCDFLRSVAGRPTSREIASAVAAKAEAEREAAVQDSLRQAEAARALADSIAKAGAPAPLAVDEPVVARYYVVVGVFDSKDHAQKKVNQCTEKGMTAKFIRFKSGKYGVLVNPSDTKEGGERMLSDLKARKLCSSSAWLLYNY